MNEYLDQIFEQTLSSIREISVDEFEQELRLAGLNPVRKKQVNYDIVLSKTFYEFTKKYSSKVIKTEISSDFSYSQNDVFKEAA